MEVSQKWLHTPTSVTVGSRKKGQPVDCHTCRDWAALEEKSRTGTFHSQLQYGVLHGKAATTCPYRAGRTVCSGLCSPRAAVCCRGPLARRHRPGGSRPLGRTQSESQRPSRVSGIRMGNGTQSTILFHSSPNVITELFINAAYTIPETRPSAASSRGSSLPRWHG